MSGLVVVAPHHDDEAIGCGGLVSRLVGSGWTAHAVVVFDPLEGRASSAGKRRLREASRAATVLGLRSFEDLGLECRASVADYEIAWSLVRVIRTQRPELLLVPHGGERDPEHRAVYRAAIEAVWLSESDFRPNLGAPAPGVGAVFGYEVWTPISHPALTVSIDGFLDRKLRAVKAYRSQMASVNYCRAAEGLAQYRGALRTRGGHAECYTVEYITEGVLTWLAVWVAPHGDARAGPLDQD